MSNEQFFGTNIFYFLAVIFCQHSIILLLEETTEFRTPSAPNINQSNFYTSITTLNDSQEKTQRLMLCTPSAFDVMWYAAVFELVTMKTYSDTMRVVHAEAVRLLDLHHSMKRYFDPTHQLLWRLYKTMLTEPECNSDLKVMCHVLWYCKVSHFMQYPPASQFCYCSHNCIVCIVLYYHKLMQ